MRGMSWGVCEDLEVGMDVCVCEGGYDKGLLSATEIRELDGSV